MNGSPPSVALQATHRSGRVRALPTRLPRPIRAFQAGSPSVLLRGSGPHTGQCGDDTEPPPTWECLGGTCSETTEWTCKKTCLPALLSHFQWLALGHLQVLLRVDLQRASVQRTGAQPLGSTGGRGWQPLAPVDGQVLERGRRGGRRAQVLGGDLQLIPGPVPAAGDGLEHGPLQELGRDHVRELGRDRQPLLELGQVLDRTEGPR